MKPADAALFSKADLDPSKLTLVASPYGNNAHQLLIVEQVSNNRACWSESGSSPTVVEPLLANFDFTGICGRSTDANGYSIRMGDQDLGLQYSLRVVQRNGDLLLVGVSNRDRTAPEIPIGRAGGVTNGFAKLYLNPGWRLTRRVYNNQALGHFYLTNDQPLNSAIAAAPVTLPAPVTPSLPKPALPKPSLPLPVSRPDIIITPNASSPSQPTRPASTAIPIPVPPPESASVTGSVRPTPVLAPSASGPTATVVVKPKPSVPPVSGQSVSGTRSPIKGKPIRVPIPSVATQPISRPSTEAMQPPTTPSVVTAPPSVQPPIARPPVTQPPVRPVQPQPAVNATTPSGTGTSGKPGNFVVPTMTL
jgi:hypothetical protein